MMSKMFTVCVAVLILAVYTECKPISPDEKLVPCEGCTPAETVLRMKRDAESLIREIGGFVNGLIHENWTHIERIRAMKKADRAVFIGNGHHNTNRVWINKRRNDYYAYDDY